jgi:deoxyribodipyrimidine photo-lyase
MNMIPFSFEPTRAAGLARLTAFAPHTARDYAANRNTDEGPGVRSGVSMLSPYIRHRMITEEEVLATVLDSFSWSSAEKFIQEVFWRAYFKGYLETRPIIWQSYLAELRHLENTKGDLAYQMAVNGKTFIACFDHWVDELKTTGYLHNHARMWFASIWIFTLKLPWQLGADFMYRHLIDGDPASNTLSWRWVGGLHTIGKTYLARPDNIAKYTNGRFHPTGLATEAPALGEPTLPPPSPVPPASSQWPEGRHGLLVTTEDLSFAGGTAANTAIPFEPISKPGGIEGNISADFRADALNDLAKRVAQSSPVHRLTTVSPETVLQWCRDEDLKTVAVAYAPVGPEVFVLAAIETYLSQHDIALVRVRRRYDTLTWPHVTKGFFNLKAQIPGLLEKLCLSKQQRLL